MSAALRVCAIFLEGKRWNDFFLDSSADADWTGFKSVSNTADSAPASEMFILTTVFNLLNLPILENFAIYDLVDLWRRLATASVSADSGSILLSPVFPEISYFEFRPFEYMFLARLCRLSSGNKNANIN